MISEFKHRISDSLRAAGVTAFSSGLHNETANGDWVDWATVNGCEIEGREACATIAILLSNPSTG